MSRIGELTKGIIKENPVLVLVIGLCPTLAVTTGLWNAVGMGLSATFVLVCSNTIVSLFSAWFPKKVRIPCYIMVIATFTTIVKMVLAGFWPDLNDSLGIFIELIVVNCIILARAEAFASKHGALDSMLDGIGIGIGFTLAITIIAGIREVLGAWQLFGWPITDGGFDPARVLVLAPGAFLVLGLVLAASVFIQRRPKDRTREALASEEFKAREAVRPSPPDKAKPSATSSPASGGA
jgi:electron transport complex protein RnfE